MALAGFARLVVGRSILGRLLYQLPRVGAVPAADALATWALRRWGPTTNETYQAFRAVADQVRRAYLFGQSLINDPMHAPALGTMPVDSTGRASDGPIHYRVLVTAVNTSTFEEITTTVDVYSNVSLSQVGVMDHARREAEARGQLQTGSPKGRGIGVGWAMQFEVLSAGRSWTP